MLAVASVGGDPWLPRPATSCVPHQLIDYTHGPRAHVLRRRRPAGRPRRLHAIRTRRRFARAASPRQRAPASRSSDGGVYGAVSGPRLETAAEIDRMDRDGATLVGMTGMPEAALARELDAALRGDLRRRQPRRRPRRQRASTISMERHRERAGDGDGSRARAARRTLRRLCARRTPAHDPRRPARWAIRACSSGRATVERFGHARARRAPRRHARHDARAERRRPRGAADRRAAAGRDLRRRAQPALSGRRAGPVHRARQPGARRRSATRWRRAGKGCLSVPGLRGVVPRYTTTRATTGFDPQGSRSAARSTGFHARVVQHECDHLTGILYPMRMRDFSRFGYTDVLFPDARRAADE